MHTWEQGVCPSAHLLTLLRAYSSVHSALFLLTGLSPIQPSICPAIHEMFCALKIIGVKYGPVNEGYNLFPLYKLLYTFRKLC
jgi:hypothetical protein